MKNNLYWKAILVKFYLKMFNHKQNNAIHVDFSYFNLKHKFIQKVRTDQDLDPDPDPNEKCPIPAEPTSL
jgi:hypothetical protein